MQRTLLYIVSFFSFSVAYAQAPKTQPLLPAFPPQDTIPAEMEIRESGDSVTFLPKLRPLRQVAGAPSSFYTYFWELGDGRFSFEKNPTYRYKDTGTYLVRLYATNNYDDGKAPPTRPRPVKIKTKGTQPGWASHFFKSKGNIEMKINRNPKPGEDFVALLGYRNQSQDSLTGSLVFFFNEKQFSQEGFNMAGSRKYNGEDSSSIHSLMAALDAPSLTDTWAKAGPFAGTLPGYNQEAKTMLQLLNANYSRNEVLRFKNVQKGEEKFIFLTMNTLPEMIQDTNATVTMSAMLIPDNPLLQPELFELEMEVVASHDPNRLQLKQRRINYRFMGKKKEITYKVRFQNTGQGPAKRVAIGIAMPRQLNTASLNVIKTSPECNWCDSAYANQSCFDTIRTADSIYFVFKNIHLPGLQQDGVQDKDSTKGFVEYNIRFKKKPKKIPFDSRAAIYFDKNEPVFTNRATGKFIKGISPGIMAGYTFHPGNDNKPSGPIQLGFVLAPYAPARPYFQFELHAGFAQEEKIKGTIERDRRDTAIAGGKFMVVGRQTNSTVKRNFIQAVPLHFRYNLNSWIGVGAGAHVQVALSEKAMLEKKVFLSDTQRPDQVVSTASIRNEEETKWFSEWNAAPFADLQFGKVKQGPALGLRYLRTLKDKGTNQFFLYGVFRL